MVLPDRRVEVALDVTTNGVNSVKRAIRKFSDASDELGDVASEAADVGDELSDVEKHLKEVGDKFDGSKRGVASYRQELSEAAAVSESVGDETNTLVGILDDLNQDGLEPSQTNLKRHIKSMAKAKKETSDYNRTLNEFTDILYNLSGDELNEFFDSFDKTSSGQSRLGEFGDDADRAKQAVQDFDDATGNMARNYKRAMKTIDQAGSSGVPMEANFLQRIYDDEAFGENNPFKGNAPSIDPSVRSVLDSADYDFSENQRKYLLEYFDSAAGIDRTNEFELVEALDPFGKPSALAGDSPEDHQDLLRALRQSAQSGFKSNPYKPFVTDYDGSGPGPAFEGLDITDKEAKALESAGYVFGDDNRFSTSVPNLANLLRKEELVDESHVRDDLGHFTGKKSRRTNAKQRAEKLQETLEKAEERVNHQFDEQMAGAVERAVANVDKVISDENRSANRKQIEKAKSSIESAFTGQDRVTVDGKQYNFNALKAFRDTQDIAGGESDLDFKKAAWKQIRGANEDLDDIVVDAMADNIYQTRKNLIESDAIPKQLRAATSQGAFAPKGSGSSVKSEHLTGILEKTVADDIGGTLRTKDGREISATKKQLKDFVREFTELLQESDELVNAVSELGATDSLRDLRGMVDGKDKARLMDLMDGKADEVNELFTGAGLKGVLPGDSYGNRLDLLDGNLKNLDAFKQQLLLQTMDDLAEDGMALTPETLEARLFQKGVNQDSEQARRAISGLMGASQSGMLGLPGTSLSEGNYGGDFQELANKNLRGILSPDEIQNVVQRIQTAFTEGDYSSIRQLTSNKSDAMAELVGDAIDLDGRDASRVLSGVSESLDSTRIGATEQSGAGVTNLLNRAGYTTNGSPDIPFGANNINNAMGKARSTGQGDVADTYIGRVLSQGISRIDASERFGDKVDLGSYRKASNRLDSLTSKAQRLVPVLGVTSANLGAFNVQLKSAAQILGGLIGTLGAVAGALGGFANAMVTATVTLGAFVGAGALAYLEQMEQTMAGVNDRGEAMQELGKQLKKGAIDALEPLMGARLGGSGPDAAGFFVDTVQAGLDLLHDFAEISRDLVEMPVMAETVERLSDAMFSGGDLTPALQGAMQKLLPGITDVLVGFIEGLPAIISGITRLADVLGESLGPSLSKAVKLLPLLIGYGEGFLRMVGIISNVLLTIVDVLADMVGWLHVFIPGVDNGREVAYGLAMALGVLAGAIYAVSTALGVLGGMLTMFTTLAKVAGFITTIMSAGGLMGVLAGSPVAMMTLGPIVMALGSVVSLLGGALGVIGGLVGGGAALGAALVLVVGVLIDVVYYLATGESLIGDMVPQVEGFYDTVGSLANGFWQWLTPLQHAKNIFEYIAGVVDYVVGGAQDFFNDVGGLFQFGYSGDSSTAPGTTRRTHGQNPMIVNISNSVMGSREFERKMQKQSRKSQRRNQTVQSKYVTQ